ncbi:hypothetical protein KIN20_005163 [Parelaphostrongylus tenuis]|uniref:Uncharacterized protein n=1 Tax=Parelaphostrongylus tenuis TaxID=148309 RepID=A0AAD5QFQ7_PARTN|nr:hypothetical protein KIN20_005163 [Parelaphostrongylus tenuis]
MRVCRQEMERVKLSFMMLCVLVDSSWSIFDKVVTLDIALVKVILALSQSLPTSLMRDGQTLIVRCVYCGT